jgi:hypothetical protein
MKEVILDYTAFKSLVSAKALLPQYADLANRYLVFAIETNISWQCTITKDGGSDQTDFEANYQSTCNQPLEYRSTDGLPKYASAMFTDSLSYWVDGTNGTLAITASTTGYIKTHFSVPFRLNGVDVHWEGANFGDYINFEVGVYNNNDTSSESNFIQLFQFADQYRVLGNDTKTFTVDTVKAIPTTYNGLDIYIRTTYVNVGGKSTNLCVNLLGYK